MILIIFIFICQEANASSGKVLIHSSYFHVHFLFFTFTPNLLTVLVVVGQPSLFTCWRAVACFLAEGPFPRSHRRPLPARKEDGGEGRGLLEDRWEKGRRNYKIFALKI